MPTPVLLPGDVLLYSGRSPFSWAIKVKTWSPYSHAELYLGDNQTATSRNEGVKTYAFTPNELALVLRPATPLDMAAVWAFHKSCIGQQYDWFGLLRFFTLGTASKNKQFCSEYVTRLLRAGGVEPFHPDYDADSVSPGMLATSPALPTIWSA